jgi:hypothetical protein
VNPDSRRFTDEPGSKNRSGTMNGHGQDSYENPKILGQISSCDQAPQLQTMLVAKASVAANGGTRHQFSAK